MRQNAILGIGCVQNIRFLSPSIEKSTCSISFSNAKCAFIYATYRVRCWAGLSDVAGMVVVVRWFLGLVIIILMRVKR